MFLLCLPPPQPPYKGIHKEGRPPCFVETAEGRLLYMAAGEVASIAKTYRRISKCALNMYIDAYIYHIALKSLSSQLSYTQLTLRAPGLGHIWSSCVRTGPYHPNYRCFEIPIIPIILYTINVTSPRFGGSLVKLGQNWSLLGREWSHSVPGPFRGTCTKKCAKTTHHTNMEHPQV